jgi:hypothetical protein
MQESERDPAARASSVKVQEPKVERRYMVVALVDVLRLRLPVISLRKHCSTLKKCTTAPGGM